MEFGFSFEWQAGELEFDFISAESAEFTKDDFYVSVNGKKAFAELSSKIKKIISLRQRNLK